MPKPQKIENHYEEMVDLLPTQFQDKENIDKLLQVWSEQIQSIEDSLWELESETKFFEAQGVNLDRYGHLLGLVRPAGMSDNEFFSIVAGEIIARSSDASMDSIRKIIEAVTGLRRTNIIDINNTVVWRNNGYPKLTGDVMVYGYYSLSDKRLSGYEGELLKKACPITTEVAIYGQHIQFDEDNNNLFIPCEIIQSGDPIGVESPLGNDPLDELVTDSVGTDNLAVSGNNFESYGLNWELAILPEDRSDGGTLAINAGNGFENLQIETEEEGSELFNVNTDGVENTHGVLLEISTSNY